MANGNDAHSADDLTFDENRLDEILESGEMPDDMEELESRLGYSSNSKNEGDDTQQASDDDSPSEQAGQGETDDETGQQAGESTDDDTRAADDDKTADPDNPEKGQQADAQADQSTADGGEKPDGEPAAQDGERTPDGVLTRDGKHVIPYTVLEQTRQQRQELEERNRQLEQELEQVRQSAQQSDQSRVQAQQALDKAEGRQQDVLERHDIQAGDLPKKDDGTFDLESLRQEYPDEVVNVLAANNREVVALRQQVEALERDRQAQAERERQLTRTSIQEQIDSIPELAEVQAEGGRRWKMAVNVDNDLKEDPDWSQTSNRLRFHEVVHLMNGGRPRTPAEAEAAIEAANQPPREPSAPVDPRERADERIQQQAGTRSAPPTHSDLPAGQKPAQSEQERLEQTDVMDLERDFSGATDPDELINRYL